MNSAFSEDSNVPEQNPKDRTKLIWLGVLILVVALLLVILLAPVSETTVSKVRARHILIAFDPQNPADQARARQRALELRQRILDGESFRKLAKEYSNDPSSSSRGGDLNWQNKGSFEHAFEEYVWSAPLGQMSEPIQTQYGYHLIEVQERRWAKADLYERELERRAKERMKEETETTPPDEEPEK